MMPPLTRNLLLLTAVLPVVSGCAVIAVTSTLIGAGLTVATTAADAALATGMGGVKIGRALVCAA